MFRGLGVANIKMSLSRAACALAFRRVPASQIDFTPHSQGLFFVPLQVERQGLNRQAFSFTAGRRSQEECR